MEMLVQRRQRVSREGRGNRIAAMGLGFERGDVLAMILDHMFREHAVERRPAQALEAPIGRARIGGDPVRDPEMKPMGQGMDLRKMRAMIVNEALPEGVNAR
jgi:hypothetical protein